MHLFDCDPCLARHLRLRQLPHALCGIGIALAPLAACDSPSPRRLDASAIEGGSAQDAAPFEASTDAAPPAFDSSPPSQVDATLQFQDCEPGRYVGTYTCENESAIIREGRLELELEVREAETDAGAECLEFCELIIRQGTGAIQGSWAGLFDFEGQLEGGLDCRSGSFEATVAEGLWGPTDLPLGTFGAVFEGVYDADAMTIEGRSEIAPDGIDGCTGEIRLQLES